MDISLFFLNYYFKGTGQIQKIEMKKKKKSAQNNVNMCRLVTEKEKKKEKGTAEENKEKK